MNPHLSAFLMKTAIFHLFILFTSVTLDAQKALSISFFPTIGHTSIVLDSNYQLGDISLSISNLKFYISELALYNNDTFVAGVGKKHHLFDMELPTSGFISQEMAEPNPFNNIRFNIGIDSLTHSAGAFEGDLDPIHGMYWSWQSGYIHFKLEGTSPDCPTRQNKFQIHVGGYQATNNTIRRVTLPVVASSTLNIEIALDKIIQRMFGRQLFQMMSPGPNAVAMADLFPQIFQIRK
jgi:hypothetical protein